MMLITCLSLARMAKEDPSLIPNHMEGPRGVDYYLKAHKISAAISLQHALEEGDDRYVKVIREELEEIREAMEVYEEAPSDALSPKP